jgi:hypothetical protein
VIHEWRPGARSALLWTPLSVVLGLMGFVIFGLAVGLRTGRVAMAGGVGDVVIVVALVAVLVVVHEGIHALAMAAFGARPEFGAVAIGKVLPAVYTTAPGHRFTRAQYLAVALAPAVILSVIGLAGCFTAVGGYLVIPLATHLAGCTGDGAASLRVLREPAGTVCEDLRDGIRFYRLSR